MNETGKKQSTPMDKLINVLIVLVIAAFVAVGVYATYGKITEGIQDRAIENGEAEKTVNYLAKQSNMTVDEYLAQYGLSIGDTITEDTTEGEMLDNMTLENYAKYNGQDADEMIEGTGLSDKVTKDTLWKDFLPQVPTISVIGSEEALNKIKEQYGLGDEVNAETPYGEFEKIIEAKQAETAASTAAPAEGEQTEAADEPADEAAAQ